MKKAVINLKEGKEFLFEKLDRALTEEVVKYSWELDLAKFPDFAPMEVIAKHPYFREIFEELNKIKTEPCLYQFDVLSPVFDEKALKEISMMREKLNEQNIKMAPVNSKPSSCLYIGIRQAGFFEKKGLSQISSRLLSHFGYYEKGAGVKLNNWTNFRSLKFNISVYKLHPDCSEFLELIEKIYSLSENPMIGRH